MVLSSCRDIWRAVVWANFFRFFILNIALNIFILIIFFFYIIKIWSYHVILFRHFFNFITSKTRSRLNFLIAILVLRHRLAVIKWIIFNKSTFLRNCRILSIIICFNHFIFLEIILGYVTFLNWIIIKHGPMRSLIIRHFIFWVIILVYLSNAVILLKTRFIDWFFLITYHILAWGFLLIIHILLISRLALFLWKIAFICLVVLVFTWISNFRFLCVFSYLFTTLLFPILIFIHSYYYIYIIFI